MKSMFDGWTKKIENRAKDGNGGFCATGWLDFGGGDRVAYTDVCRVGRWIQDNLNPPDLYVHKLFGHVLHPAVVETDAIIWANNECKLDIEGFKMVDLLTQGFVPEPAAEAVEEEKVSV